MKTVYNAELIGIGTELLLGKTVNTDARDLSVYLSEIGINVLWHTVVGDNPKRLSDAVEIAKNRADIIITTGGLGPTCDDLTKTILAQSFGLSLEYNEEAAERIRELFKSLDRPMTENNLQQAYLPEKCTVFQNFWGTAPGCAFNENGKIVMMLPGPPRECNAMFKHWGKPYLSSLSGDVIVSHNLHVFGVGESQMEHMLRDEMNRLTNPTLAPYAKEGECFVRVTAKAESEEVAEEMMKPVIEYVYSVLGEYIYGIDCESLEKTAFNLMKEKQVKLATAESCTGGMIASRMTDLAGASGVFCGGVVTYSDKTKAELLGIDPEIIAEKGAVSAEVAELMAKNVRKLLNSDIGISTTGIAGPETDGKNEVGTVFIALATAEKVVVKKMKLGARRDRIRLAAANNAFDFIRRFLSDISI